MSTEQNKAVVRRFITEALEGGNLAVLDEVLAPNYVNPAMGGADLAGFKAILTGMAAAVSLRFTIQELVADGIRSSLASASRPPDRMARSCRPKVSPTIGSPTGRSSKTTRSRGPILGSSSAWRRRPPDPRGYDQALGWD